MARKRKYVIAFLLMAVLLVGCSKNEETKKGKGYSIFYTNVEGTKLVSKSFAPVSDRFDGILTEVLNEFKNPTHSDVVSAMPPGVEINGYTMGVDNLQVDFNGAYLGLSNVQEILLRSGIAKTLVQLPGVAKVRITVDGQTLLERDGNEVLAMDEKTFIDPQGDGINSYHYVTLNLYFANGSGDKVAKEVRNVFYSSNLIMEKVIVEQIIQGPINTKFRAVVVPEVLVKSVKISNNICVIDLDSKFNNVPGDGSVTPEACLYAFVNAICDACDVEGVRFCIEGESDVRFRGEVNLDRVFYRNPEMIESTGVTSALAEIFVNEKGDETDQMILLEAAEKSAEQTTEKAEKTGTVETEAEAASAASGNGNTGGNQSGRGVGVDSALVEEVQ